MHIRTCIYTHVHTQILNIYYAEHCRSKAEQKQAMSFLLVPGPCGTYTLKGSRYESNNHNNICYIKTDKCSWTRGISAMRTFFLKKEMDLFRKLFLKGNKTKGWVGLISSRSGVTRDGWSSCCQSPVTWGRNAFWGTKTSCSEWSSEKGEGKEDFQAEAGVMVGCFGLHSKSTEKLWRVILRGTGTCLCS